MHGQQTLQNGWPQGEQGCAVEQAGGNATTAAKAHSGLTTTVRSPLAIPRVARIETRPPTTWTVLGGRHRPPNTPPAASLPSSAKPPRGEGAVFSEDGASANGRVLPAAVGNDLPLCLTAWRLSALAFTAPFRAKRGGCWATADRRGFSARRNNRARTRQIGDEMVACARKPLRTGLLQPVKPRGGGCGHQRGIVGPAGRDDPVGGREAVRGLQCEARRGRRP